MNEQEAGLDPAAIDKVFYFARSDLREAVNELKISTKKGEKYGTS